MKRDDIVHASRFNHQIYDSSLKEPKSIGEEFFYQIKTFKTGKLPAIL